jgi:hypothetical protein
MTTKVQARLDEETQAALDRVRRKAGWSTSEVIREGIRLFDLERRAGAAEKMIGIGMFRSGAPDIGSNKKHLEGLGSNSGIRRGSRSTSRFASKRKAS